VTRLAAVALLIPMLAMPAAQERPLPDFATFAAQVKKKLATDEERQSGLHVHRAAHRAEARRLRPADQ
jgi:hypothetical protein